MKVNAVFEGGGVKAIGLAGAVTEAQRRGVIFHKVAGTSSGAIIAALLAAGYSGEEMRKIIMETPFSSFLHKTWLNQTTIGQAIRLLVKKGLYSGESLEYWIYNLLAAKGVKTFGDLGENKLRVIASDISDGRILVLPDDIHRYGIDPHKFTVAKAIRMSTSIPYFFDPVIIRTTFRQKNRDNPELTQPYVYIVDGGLLSNFPLWIYDHDPLHDKLKPVPTLGFQLVGVSEKKARVIRGPLSMFQALFATMMDAHDEQYIEEDKSLQTIKIPTLGVQTTQFDISPKMSMALFESGVAGAAKFFSKWPHKSSLS